MKKIVCTIMMAACFLVTAWSSDFILLNNSLFFEGKIVSVKSAYIIFEARSERYVIPVEDVCEYYFENQENSTSQFEIPNSDQELCLKAKADATLYHRMKPGHFFLGFFFGGFALLGTAISNPTPYRGKETLLKSKNKEYFDDPVYLQCYKRTARKELLLAETAGWASWLILFAALRN